MPLHPIPPRALRTALVALAAAGALAGAPRRAAAHKTTFAEQNRALMQQLREVHALTESQMRALTDIFARGEYIGQGNPEISEHPMSPAECSAKLQQQGVDYARPDFDRICGAPFMAPLFDPARETPASARTCIDRFEFPDIPCAYPVVWVRAREAAQICAAIGKRMCDAHEWEGACEGSLEPPDYRFDLAAGQPPSAAVARMRNAHNAARSPHKRWAYGPDYQRGICAAASRKTPGCEGGGWRQCGSNTYPAGAFPECRSRLEVLDLHGNAAEHMNLPLAPEEMASRDPLRLGHTEMKGSWFIFDHYRAHEDWCRWRAPYWHGSRVMDASSHHNYHLGFRCCKDVGG